MREFAKHQQAAIVGLGMTDIGKVYDRTAAEFAAEAVRLAVADAGLTIGDVDGMLISNGLGGGVTIRLPRDLGMRDLRMLSEITSYGATAIAQVQYACLAVAGGLAKTVVCVHADAPLKPASSSGDTYRSAATARRGVTGFGGFGLTGGLRGANNLYAFAARRHMAHFGTTSEDFGHIAVAQRAWATMNPLAQFRTPLTIEDHQSSRWIVDPLHLFDCCTVSNGAIAVVVTSADRSRHLAQPPVYPWAWAQVHPGTPLHGDSDFGLVSGGTLAAPVVMKMAGITADDIDIRELYDCYTYTTMITLEDYGFCAKGEGGAFAASGALGPGGSHPTNTGGGQLSSYYLWGMTPLSEAVIQARGQAGERQVPKHDVVLVTGNGGILDHHAALVLGTQPCS